MVVRRTKYFGVLAVLVFLLSLLWHIPANFLFKSAQEFLPADVQALDFQATNGTLWQGSTQVLWALPDGKTHLDAGQLSWQQSAADLLSSVQPKLHWQTQFGQWQGQLDQAWSGEQTLVKTADLQLNIAALQKWLAPFMRSPIEVQGQVLSQDLTLSWSPEKLLTAIEGNLLLQGLSAMGVTLPPVRLQVTMPDKNTQIVHWSLSAQADGYSMQGSGTLDANPASKAFANYEGVLEVKAAKLEQMPDFALLLPQVSDTHSKLSLKGNLQRLQTR